MAVFAWFFTCSRGVEDELEMLLRELMKVAASKDVVDNKFPTASKRDDRGGCGAGEGGRRGDKSTPRRIVI